MRDFKLSTYVLVAATLSFQALTCVTPAFAAKSSTSTNAAAPAASIHWLSDLKVAMAEARKTNKPVLIDFYTDWCGWCKRLDTDVYPDKTVIAASQKFVMVRLNAEKNGAKEAEKYQIDGYPTAVVLSPEGKQLTQIVGYEPAATYAQHLNAIQTAYHKSTTKHKS